MGVGAQKVHPFWEVPHMCCRRPWCVCVRGRGYGGHTFADLGLTWFHFFIVGLMVAIALSQLFRLSAVGACGRVSGWWHAQRLFRQELCRLEVCWVQAEWVGRYR